MFNVAGHITGEKTGNRKIRELTRSTPLSPAHREIPVTCMCTPNISFIHGMTYYAGRRLIMRTAPTSALYHDEPQYCDGSISR